MSVLLDTHIWIWWLTQLEAILIAGPLGPSPRVFGFGVAAFIVGYLLMKRTTGE